MTPPTAPEIDSAAVRSAIEYYYDQGWTDGLPVVPVTESYLAEFLAATPRGADEVLLRMPHLEREITVRVAAINAALAGCLPEYLPVVIAAWESFQKEGYATKGIWQSTTGTAPFFVVNGPVREALGVNCAGNVFGSGFRANASMGRAIRLGAINCFGLKPHELDQATQGTPAKYTACIGENEEASPWAPFHVDQGFAPDQSTVTAMICRSVMQIEARHTVVPEQLAMDFADSIARTGALIHETISSCIVLNPEHAALLDRAGWSKQDLRQAVFDRARISRERLQQVGKDMVSKESRWRVPAAHPDAVDDTHTAEGRAGDVAVLASVEALQVVVAGAPNAGVSAVVDTFGPRGEAPFITAVDLP